MIPISYVTGDATDPQVPGPKIITHVCNDVGGWGAGFVLALSRRWPKPEHQYRSWHRFRGSVPFELGLVQFVDVGPELLVANMIAQAGYVKSFTPPIRYDAVEMCLLKVASVAAPWPASVHMPRIGCGLGGATWERIEPIIERTLCAADIPVYVYDLAQ